MRYIDFSIAKTSKQKQLILESYLSFPDNEIEREKYLKYFVMHAHYMNGNYDYDDLLEIYDDSSEDFVTKIFSLGKTNSFYDSQKSKIISEIVKSNSILGNLLAQARLFKKKPNNLPSINKAYYGAIGELEYLSSNNIITDCNIDALKQAWQKYKNVSHFLYGFLFVRQIKQDIYQQINFLIDEELLEELFSEAESLEEVLADVELQLIIAFANDTLNILNEISKMQGKVHIEIDDIYWIKDIDIKENPLGFLPKISENNTISSIINQAIPMIIKPFSENGLFENEFESEELGGFILEFAKGYENLLDNPPSIIKDSNIIDDIFTQHFDIFKNLKNGKKEFRKKISNDSKMAESIENHKNITENGAKEINIFISNLYKQMLDDLKEKLGSFETS